MWMWPALCVVFIGFFCFIMGLLYERQNTKKHWEVLSELIKGITETVDKLSIKVCGKQKPKFRQDNYEC